jgi:2-amino-4-hydroxy-6-hydroxymethyldihydropteridine diphosphokinase
MARAVLALGANMSDPARQIEQAIEAIADHPQIALLKQSTVIVTPPWGKTDQAEFHNAAVLIETTLEPLELLDFCLATEAEIGRVRLEKWGPRAIDIDVIAYDDLVLDPVREIAPDIADWLVHRTGRKSS